MVHCEEGMFDKCDAFVSSALQPTFGSKRSHAEAFDQISSSAFQKAHRDDTYCQSSGTAGVDRPTATPACPGSLTRRQPLSVVQKVDPFSNTSYRPGAS